MTDAYVSVPPPVAAPYAGWIVEPPAVVHPSPSRVGIVFAWGLLSPVAAIILSLPFASGLTASTGRGVSLATFLVMTFLAPTVEEACKAGAILLGTRRLRPALLADGWILLGAASGFAFSIIENVLYALTFAVASPTYGGFLLLQRFLISSPTHMMASSLVAYGLGTWRERRDPVRAIGWMVAGLAVHGGANAWFLKLAGGW